jgi:FixJ family two-component response regulator
MTQAAATVFLVDDEASVLKAVSRLLGTQFNVRTFASAADFLTTHDPDAPGCLVLDMAMPGLDGLELQQALAQRGSLLPIVFLTGHADIPASVKAMKSGAVDFLTKPVDAPVLIQAVQAGLDKSLAARREQAQRAEIQRRLASLTPREREVLNHLITGQINKQIAADLGTVEKTIKVHRAHVLEKMKVHSIAELVWLAERTGIRPDVLGGS